MKKGVSYGVFLSLVIPGGIFLGFSLLGIINFISLGSNSASYFDWRPVTLWLTEALPFVAAIVALRREVAGCILGLFSLTAPLFVSVVSIIENYDSSLMLGIFLLIPTSIYLAGAIMGLKEAAAHKRTLARA